MKRALRTVLAACLGVNLLGVCDSLLAETKTLRFVAQADVKIIDPTFTPVYISRNFGYMVYDTLFAQDANGIPRPQMVDKWTSSKDGKAWSFTLRPGLKFSDGSAVTSADCIASLLRWSSRDSLGREMVAAGAEWKAIDANTFTLTLKQPFGLVLDGLARPSGLPPVILPERLARMPTTAPLTEVIGSGPYLFKRDEWVPGNKVVFVKNPAYVGRMEPASGLAGNKTPHIDRVEWLYLPDSNSSTAALQRGEVDMIEQVPPDYITPLRGDASLSIGSGGSYQGFMAFNQPYPPFDKAKARQAVLHAVNQEKYVASMGFPLEMRMTHCATWFICGGPNDTQAGAEPYRKPDLVKARQLLAESGYKGEKVVVLVPTDIPQLNAAALVTVQTLKSIGMNVDAQTGDYGTVGVRRMRKDPPESGGWNVHVFVAGEFDVNSPMNNAYLAAACGTSAPGWPCDKPLDALRTAWVRETVPAKRREALDRFQERAFEAVPYAYFGQYSSAYAARKTVKNLGQYWSIPNLWVLDK